MSENVKLPIHGVRKKNSLPGKGRSLDRRAHISYEVHIGFEFTGFRYVGSLTL